MPPRRSSRRKAPRKSGYFGFDSISQYERVIHSFILIKGNDQVEEEKRYCICNGTDDGTFMLACDLCDEWYHGRCVKISKAEAENSEYICNKCKEGKGSL